MRGQIMKCIECTHCNVEEMKCFPESEDCKTEYDLTEHDLYAKARCDFAEKKWILYSMKRMGIMDKMYANDFNLVEYRSSGQFVRISEINKMIEYGIITVDRSKIKEYKFDTTVMYNKDKYTREEAMRLWYGSR